MYFNFCFHFPYKFSFKIICTFLFLLCIVFVCVWRWIFAMTQMVKNPPANAGDTGDSGSIPEWERSSGGWNGNPLQYSCLRNPMDRKPGRLQSRRFQKSRTKLSNWKRKRCIIFRFLSLFCNWLLLVYESYGFFYIVLLKSLLLFQTSVNWFICFFSIQ